jgi:hypothetical protein
MFGGQLSLDKFPELRTQAQGTYDRLQEAFKELGEDASFAAAAAWSLVHGLAHLILDGHFEDKAGFVKKVLGSIRFAVGAQRPA